jgi:hypothetical protein
VPESYHFRLAATDGTVSGHEGRKKLKGIPINESALCDVEAAAMGQQVRIAGAVARPNWQYRSLVRAVWPAPHVFTSCRQSS